MINNELDMDTTNKLDKVIEDVADYFDDKNILLQQKKKLNEEIESFFSEKITNFDTKNWIDKGMGRIEGYMDSIEKIRIDISKVGYKLKTIENLPNYKQLMISLSKAGSFSTIKDVLFYREQLTNNFGDFILRLYLLNMYYNTMFQKLNIEIKKARAFSIVYFEQKSYIHELLGIVKVNNIHELISNINKLKENFQKKENEFFDLDQKQKEIIRSLEAKGHDQKELIEHYEQENKTLKEENKRISEDLTILKELNKREKTFKRNPTNSYDDESRYE